MMIRTKLKIGLLVTLVLAILCTVSIYNILRSNIEKDQIVQLLDHIKDQNSDSVKAIHEYLLYQSDRPLQQARLNLTSLKIAQKDIQPFIPENKEELDILAHETSQLENILVRIQSGHLSQELSAVDRDIQEAKLKRLTGRVLIHTELLDNVIEKINSSVELRFKKVLKKNNTLFFAILATFILTMAVITVWVFMRIIPPLRLLQKGTETVSSGDYVSKIDLPRKDELGSLAQSFNYMTEQLRIKEILLNKSQEIAHLGSWHLDLEKNILTWSAEECRLFGRDSQDCFQTYESFLDAVHPDDRAMVDKTYRDAIKNKQFYECIHRVVLKDGTVRIVLEKSEEVLDEYGKTIHSFGFTQDITDLKLAEEEREKLIKKLQAALDEVKALRGILPICLHCKAIRNDEGYYEQIEAYIHKNSGVDFSHTICPACMKKHYPEEYELIKKDNIGY